MDERQVFRHGPTPFVAMLFCLVVFPGAFAISGAPWIAAIMGIVLALVAWREAMAIRNHRIELTGDLLEEYDWRGRKIRSYKLQQITHMAVTRDIHPYFLRSCEGLSHLSGLRGMLELRQHILRANPNVRVDEVVADF